MDTLFSQVADIVNRRPIAVKNFTDDDFQAITPNDLLLGRSRNMVPGPVYGFNDSITKRQELIEDMEQLWWDQWVKQAFPHLVPFKRWKWEHRNLRPGDIVSILYDKKIGKGEFKMGRVLSVHPDSHGTVRTVTVGMRGKDPAGPYVPKALTELKLGLQSVAVICPVEEQSQVSGTEGDEH